MRARAWFPDSSVAAPDRPHRPLGGGASHFRSVRRRRRDAEPQAARGVAAPADERELAQDAARGGRRAVAAQLEIAAALDARRGARFSLDDRRRCDLDWPLRRAPRQLAREPLGAPYQFPERAFIPLVACDGDEVDAPSFPILHLSPELGGQMKRVRDPDLDADGPLRFAGYRARSEIGSSRRAGERGAARCWRRRGWPSHSARHGAPQLWRCAGRGGAIGSGGMANRADRNDWTAPTLVNARRRQLRACRWKIAHASSAKSMSWLVVPKRPHRPLHAGAGSASCAPCRRPCRARARGRRARARERCRSIVRLGAASVAAHGVARHDVGEGAVHRGAPEIPSAGEPGARGASCPG